MTKRQRRLLTILIILALIFLSLVGYYAYYRSTKKLSFNLTGDLGEALTPPEFLYSFSGAEGQRLQRPIGVLVHKGRVYVADAPAGKVQVFNERGVWQRSIGGTECVTPLYIAWNPKDNNLYVSDRRQRAVHKYSLDGKYLGDFNPRLPKKELPSFNTGGVQWVPLALAFGEDGTFYATEILKGHRLLIFDPKGKFKRSVGTAAIVIKPEKAPKVFQFPNGMIVFNKEVYIADSNNRRIQVFDLKGDYKRLIVTQGLPRGVAGLSPLPSDNASSPARIVTVDTLAHDATIWTSKGQKVLNFGEQGLLDGQFSYPTSTSIGSKNRIFITDTTNGRVQVWGWVDQVAEVPGLGSPSRLIWCLVPLALLPLLLLFRRKKYFATADFVQELVRLEEEDLLTSARRVRWVTTADQHALIKDAPGGEPLAEVFDVWEHSEPDAQALMEKYEIEYEAAVILSVAQRTRLFCTEDESLLIVAGRMEIDAANARDFIKRQKRREADDSVQE